MSNDDSMAAAAASRRAPRQGAGGAPAGSTLSIVLAVIAVVAGFLILRNITDDGGTSANVDLGDAGNGGGTATTVVNPASSVATTPTTTTTTTIPRITEGATVVVANVNGVGGSAGAMTKTLELAGYTMGTAVNGTGPNIGDSIVYYDATVAAALDVANSVGNDLGGLSVLPVPTPPPTESGQLDGAGVLVMLGDNQAGRTLDEIQSAAAAASTTDAAVEAPPVAGSGDATTTTIGE